MTDQSYTDPQDTAPDLKTAQEAVEEILKRRMGAVAKGAAADIQRYAAEMSVDLTLAAATQDTRAMEHLAAQSKLLAEKHRLAMATSLNWMALQEFTLDLATALAAGLAVGAVQ